MPDGINNGGLPQYNGGGSSGGGSGDPTATPCNNLPLSPTINYLNVKTYLNQVLSLSSNQNTWLETHPEEGILLYNQLIGEEEIGQEEIVAAKIVLESMMAGLFTNWQEIIFKTILENSLPIELRIYKDIVYPYVKLQYAIEADKDPTLKNTIYGQCKLLYRAYSEFAHLSLDLAGLIPVAGEIFDLGNSAWYALEGDYFNATLSAASAVPIIGTIPAAAKIVISAKTIMMVKVAGGLWHLTRDSRAFRKTIGLLAGDSRIAHHIIPLFTEKHDIVQLAANAGFDMKKAFNGLPLDPVLHGYNHAPYSTKVENAMNAIEVQLGTNINPTLAKEKLEELIAKIRNEIWNHPNTPINDLIF